MTEYAVYKLLETIQANQLQLMAMVAQLLAKETKMAIDVSALTAGVAQQTTVDGSIITLLDNVAAQLAAISSGSTDAATQAQIDALVATINNNNSNVVADVVKNTPAAPSALKPAG